MQLEKKPRIPGVEGSDDLSAAQLRRIEQGAVPVESENVIGESEPSARPLTAGAEVARSGEAVESGDVGSNESLAAKTAAPANLETASPVTEDAALKHFAETRIDDASVASEVLTSIDSLNEMLDDQQTGA